MSDLISRQRVLSLAKDVILEGGAKHRCVDATEIELLPAVVPEPMIIHVSKEFSKEEYERFRRDIKNAPVVLQPSAQPEQRWIPCSERMPEEGSWAIWCSNKGSIQVARWKIDAWDHFFPDQGFFELEDAVAWMPLPEPYMGGEQE